MDKTARKILKKLVIERELTLGEISKLLPKKFADYRDFYPVAGLCVDGMAQTELSSPNNREKFDEKFLASYFYAHTLGIGSHKVNMYTAMNRGGEESMVTVYATVKADTYFSERKAKMYERVITTTVGFVLGVASTLLGQWLKSIWFGNS